MNPSRIIRTKISFFVVSAITALAIAIAIASTLSGCSLYRSSDRDYFDGNAAANRPQSASEAALRISSLCSERIPPHELADHFPEGPVAILASFDEDRTLARCQIVPEVQTELQKVECSISNQLDSMTDLLADPSLVFTSNSPTETLQFNDGRAVITLSWSRDLDAQSKQALFYFCSVTLADKGESAQALSRASALGHALVRLLSPPHSI